MHSRIGAGLPLRDGRHRQGVAGPDIPNGSSREARGGACKAPSTGRPLPRGQSEHRRSWPARLVCRHMPRERKSAEEGPDTRREPPQWPRCAASAAIFRGATVLLVQRGTGDATGVCGACPAATSSQARRQAPRPCARCAEETAVEAEKLCRPCRCPRRHFARRDGALLAHYLIAVFCGRWLAGEPEPGGDEIAARFVPIEHIDDSPACRLTDGAAALIHRAWAQISRPAKSRVNRGGRQSCDAGSISPAGRLSEGRPPRRRRAAGSRRVPGLAVSLPARMTLAAAQHRLGQPVTVRPA